MAQTQAQRVFGGGNLTKPFCRPNEHFSSNYDAPRFIHNFELLIEHYGLAGVRGTPRFWKWLAIALIFDFVPGLSSRASKLGRPKVAIQFERRRAAQMLHRIAVEVRRSHPSMSQIKFVQLVAKEFQRRYPNNPLAQKHWRTIERTWRPDIWQMTHWTALEMAAAIEFMGDRKHKFAGHSLKQGHGLGRAFHLQNGLSEMNDAADLEGMVRKASEAADGRIICQGFLGRDRIRARRRSQR